MAGWRGSINVGPVVEQMRGGARAGLRAAVEHLLAEAMTLVPNEEGTLSRSGRATVDDAALRGAVSFDTIYSVRQHEELSWRHSDGRSAKYLEIPLTREAGTVSDLIAAEIRRALR